MFGSRCQEGFLQLPRPAGKGVARFFQKMQCAIFGRMDLLTPNPDVLRLQLAVVAERVQRSMPT